MQKSEITNESLQRKRRYGRTDARMDRAEFIGPSGSEEKKHSYEVCAFFIF